VTWLFRQAQPDDLNVMMGLETATFGIHAWSAETMLADVTQPHCYYLVASHPDRPDAIAGYAGLLCPQGASDADIQTIAVAESARRSGLGRVLMASLLAEARQRGAQRAFLEVRADNQGAHKLYDSLGFVSIGVRPAYYQPDGVDAIVMKCEFVAARGILPEDQK